MSGAPPSHSGLSHQEFVLDVPDTGIRARPETLLPILENAAPTHDSNNGNYHYSPSLNSVPALTADNSSCLSEASVPTSLGSAVSGIPPFENDASAETQQQPRLHYECFAHYLGCHQDFVDWDQWDTHCRSHFKQIGPPIRGSRCPFCRKEFEPTTLSQTSHISPLSQRQLGTIGKRAREAGRPEYEMDAEFRRQADVLWRMRQTHVAQHFERGWSNAASTPDYAMIDHMYNKKLIHDHVYKDLMGDSARAGQQLRRDSSPYTSVGGGRRERDR